VPTPDLLYKPKSEQFSGPGKLIHNCSQGLEDTFLLRNRLLYLVWELHLTKIVVRQWMEQFTKRNDSLTHTSIVSRGLPSADLIAKCGGSNQDKSALILQCLRRTAQRNRRKKSRPFYSIRTVASHFAVPPTTVSRIFTRLRDEGILTTVWGSRTFVQPFHLDKQVRIRGVVALPALLSTFCILPETRMFFANTRNALWKLGFATRLLFYQGDEGETPTFAEKLLSYKPDVVIWFLPNSRNRKMAARLLDRGIRLISVGDWLVNSGGDSYYVDRRGATREALVAWRRDGIHSVTIVHQTGCESAGKIASIEASLRDIAIPHTIAKIELLRSQEHLRVLSQRGNSAVIFPSSEFAAQLACRNPVQFRALLERCRVMLVEGMIDPPTGDSFDATVDLITVDWQAAAKRIGGDLVTPLNNVERGDPIIFEARWVRRATNNEAAPRL
jgi:hypothetical protein